ncbi:flagellin N-terminal helical domain-containing protein [Chitinilyticum piscinae]|uniref:Flagellin n=1 Tax=Chitinilyticum piscinae TaxID=2866724 RepID=A0A8J7G2A5_9NEIS|nr:flagellin [Chitinilyticum piscinae]MBE9610088.1 flagellin FliC [Chitinilyticum piscinae]
MISSIGSNTLSLATQRFGDTAGIAQNKTLSALASGKRVNSAADDPAASAIIEQFAAQIAGNNQAVRNLNDGISLSQTAEGALSGISDNTQRLRELSVAAGNSTLSASDRQALQAEADQLSQANDDIVRNSQFNGQPLLQGNSFTLQSGPNTGDRLTINTDNLSGSQGLASTRGRVDLSSPAAASASIDELDGDLQRLSEQRSNLGAVQSRIEAGIGNLQTTAINQAASKSRIGDTDYAAATSRLAQEQIRQQAANAIQVQANAQPAQVLSLLR